MKNIHIIDDTGKEYPISMSGGNSLDDVRTDTIDPGKYVNVTYHQIFRNIKFQGQIPTNATKIYLVIDEIAGMRDLRWVYNLD